MSAARIGAIESAEQATRLQNMSVLKDQPRCRQPNKKTAGQGGAGREMGPVDVIACPSSNVDLVERPSEQKPQHMQCLGRGSAATQGRSFERILRVIENKVYLISQPSPGNSVVAHPDQSNFETVFNVIRNVLIF